MTSYINSVQYTTVTIATSLTTGTANVNTTGTPFIVYLGQTTAQATDPSKGQARVEITSTIAGVTLITATRNTLDASNTVVVSVAIVDATSSLVASVQHGTFAFGTGDTSKTATISSVNTSNSAVFFLGYLSNRTTYGYSNMDTVLDLTNGTTVTGTKQFNGPTETVGFCVVEFQGAALNSNVQKVSYSRTPSNQSSSTTTITSVDVNKTMLAYGGSYGNSGANASTTRQRATLTNGTTITFNTNGNSSVLQVYNCTVIEFAAGVLNSNAQRGTIALSAANSNTATVTSVSTTNTLVNWLNNTSSATSAAADTVHHRITQTNATTLTEVSTNNSTGTGSYEVLEFVGGSTDQALTFSATAAGSITATLACDKQLLLSQTADGSISANLYRQRLMDFAATAAGSISATLACDKQLLLTAQAAGSISATIAKDARLLLSATGAGSITATLNYDATIATSLTAAGTLTASMIRDLAMVLGAGGAGSLAATLAVDVQGLLTAASISSLSATIKKDAGAGFNPTAVASFVAALTTDGGGACNLTSDGTLGCSIGIDRGLSFNQSAEGILAANLTIVQGNPNKYGVLGDSNLMDNF